MWLLGGSLGHHFGVFGLLLAAILEVWGLPWASFLGLWGSSGLLGAPLGRPRWPKPDFPIFLMPFWDHFGLILEVKTDEHFDLIFDGLFD